MKYRILDNHGTTVTIEKADSNVAFGIIMSYIDTAIDSAYSNGSATVIIVSAYKDALVDEIHVGIEPDGKVTTYWNNIIEGNHDTAISLWLEEMERR